jgi:PPM family protein phosphatase
VRIVQSAGVSDTGRRRRRNEDSYVVRPPLFAVADGMGGAQAGELASRLATEALAGSGDGAAKSAEERVLERIRAANRSVYDRSHADTAVSGMGTTMTVACVDGEDVVVGHVGDSRAYLVRDGEIEQLTHDHSLVGELVRSGELSPEEAEGHPQRSVITRALGTDPDVEIDAFTLVGQPGDIVLLCSDGLTTMVSDDDILETIEAHRADLHAAAEQLVSRANRGGGDDNITVVCFELGEDGAGAVAGDGHDQQAVAGAEDAEDEEDDTLDELDGVPTVATIPGHEPGQPAEGRGSRDRLDAIARRAVALLVVVALVLLGIALVYWGLTA